MAIPYLNPRTSLFGKRLGFGPQNELIANGRVLMGPTGPKVSPIWENAPHVFDPAYAYQMFDDFMYPASATASDVTTWTVMSDGSTGTPAFQDAAGGIFNVVTAAADNDYSGYRSTHQPFLFAAGKRLWLEARFKVAEATTSESTWWFGLSDTVTTGGMQANTGGPLASYDGALIWKTPETALTVNFETSNAGTQNTLSAFATAISNTWHRAGFYFDGAATTSKVHPYFHNGTEWTAGTPQDITLSGLEEMYLIYGIKAGPSGGAETLQVDWIRCLQLR